jgi:short subunit dehydrogenase-like uncharacterized protein
VTPVWRGELADGVGHGSSSCGHGTASRRVRVKGHVGGSAVARAREPGYTGGHDEALDVVWREWLHGRADRQGGGAAGAAADPRGQEPGAAIEKLAGELGLEHRVFDLGDGDALTGQIEGMALVLHTAGPFSATSEPMLTGCLRAGAHYLDITGEIGVFEACKARDAEARARGVVVMPGVGFDVVPSDCLARALAEALPGAVKLELAFQALGSMSRGTMKTMMEHVGHGVQVRRGGKIETVPAGSLQQTIEFSGKRRTVVAIGWGDVSTAYHSTGIGDITVSMTMPPAQLRGLKVLTLLGPLLRATGGDQAAAGDRGADGARAERAAARVGPTRSCGARSRERTGARWRAGCARRRATRRR